MKKKRSCPHHFKWNGSPFAPMDWEYIPSKKYPILRHSTYGHLTAFNEWECKICGLKRQVVSGYFSDRDKTPFRFTRDNNFIQPTTIEGKNMEFLETQGVPK